MGFNAPNDYEVKENYYTFFQENLIKDIIPVSDA